MTLSATDDYNLSRDQIIKSAFEIIGVDNANEPLQPEDIATAAVALNVLSLAWKAHGLQLWKRETATLTPVAGTYNYELTPTLGTGTQKPMRLLEVNRKDSNGNETSLNRLSLEEYDALPNKTTQGIPVSYYFEPQRNTSKIWLWLAPDTSFVAESTIEYIYQAPMNDMTIGTEDIDYPNEWYDAIILQLAVRLAPRNGLDIKERELLQIQADAALDLVLSYDVEDTSMYLSPDNKGMR